MNPSPGAGHPLPTTGPGPAAVCPGTVMHHRYSPADHRFTYLVSYVWFDPDNPDDLCRHHRLWSAHRPAPVWFRRSDYLDGGPEPLGTAVRRRVAEALGAAPDGPIRTLTQLRTWGWLFNPITIHLLWPGDDGSLTATDAAPTAALVEVTNTPWKERHPYPVALTPAAATGAGGWAVEACFAKVLHVSPFLDEDHRYHLRIVDTPTLTPTVTGGERRRLRVDLDVFPGRPTTDPQPPDCGRIHTATFTGTTQRGRGWSSASGSPASNGPTDDEDGHDDHDRPADRAGPAMTASGAANRDDVSPILTTRLVVDRRPADRLQLGSVLRSAPLPTHRVSVGIHRQALALWRRGVPFVPHPRRRGDRRP